MEFQSTRPCGARHPTSPIARCRYEFQSTRPCGARLNYRLKTDLYEEFQSTRPCGARHEPHDGLGRLTSFNPRARAGRDRPLITY